MNRTRRGLDGDAHGLDVEYDLADLSVGQSDVAVFVQSHLMEAAETVQAAVSSASVTSLQNMSDTDRVQGIRYSFLSSTGMQGISMIVLEAMLRDIPDLNGGSHTQLLDFLKRRIGIIKTTGGGA